MSEGPVGVMLLNLGGPASEARIPDFLKRMLSDPDVVTLPWPLRPTLARLIAWRRSKRVAQHYRLIGGKSPIGPETRAQVESLRSELGDGYVVRYAFRHASPFCDQVLSSLVESGVRRVIALPAYPHWSRSTTGSAFDDLERCARPLGLAVSKAPSFPDGPGYVDALVDHISPLIGDGAHLILSAHGLPASMIRKGDPYVDEVQKTVAAVGERLPDETPMSLAFQSRLGPVEWTRPYLTDEIARLSAEGVRKLTVAPVSFVTENFETLYELDHEVAELAREKGIQDYRRARAPGCHPAFIRELSRVIHRTAAQAGWEEDVDG